MMLYRMIHKPDSFVSLQVCTDVDSDYCLLYRNLVPRKQGFVSPNESIETQADGDGTEPAKNSQAEPIKFCCQLPIH